MKKIWVVLGLLTLLVLFLPKHTQAATYDMANTANWNIRWDGAVADDRLSSLRIEVADINSDGKQDILMGAFTADKNSRNDSGSLYVIYNDLFASLSESGNTIDLADTSQFSIRFDGAGAGDLFPEVGLKAADLDGNDKLDIVASAGRASNNSRTNSGSLYVISDAILDNYSGTGNIVDMASSTSYFLRFDGALATHVLSYSGFQIADLNDDNAQDILVGAWDADYNSRTNSGSVYLLYNDIFSSYSGTGNTIDLADSSKWNIRFDGQGSGNNLFRGGSHTIGDVDNDGRPDILMGGPGVANNSRTNSGSLYVIFNSLYSTITGTGNTVDLATPTNYNLRYDGAATTDVLSWGSVKVADLDMNGKTDILVGSRYTDNNARSASGSLYLVYDTLIDNYTGTGNTIDLANQSNFTLRFDGPNTDSHLSYQSVVAEDMNGNGIPDVLVTASGANVGGRSENGALYLIQDGLLSSLVAQGASVDLASTNSFSHVWFGERDDDDFALGTFHLFDINSDGKKDFILPTWLADNNGRTDSGSIFLIYNFPHTITLNPYTAKSWDTFTVSGTVSAPDSVTTIDGVEYQVDGNSPTAGWVACTASDGNFDGLSEEFVCSLPKLSEAQHTLYVRAYDTNTSYTAQSAYTTSSIDLRPGLSGSSRSYSLPSFARRYEGYVFTAHDIRVVLEQDAIPFDNTLAVSLLNAPQTLCGLRPVSPIYALWLTDIHNGARVLPQLHTKPSLLTIAGQALVSKNLKIAYTNASDPLNTCSWRILPTSVADTINHTVAALHKIGGYYMVVSRGSGETFLNMSAVRGVSSPEPEDVPLSVENQNSVVPQQSLTSAPGTSRSYRGGVETSVRSGTVREVEKRSNIGIFLDFVVGSVRNLLGR